MVTTIPSSIYLNFIHDLCSNFEFLSLTILFVLSILSASSSITLVFFLLFRMKRIGIAVSAGDNAAAAT